MKEKTAYRLFGDIERINEALYKAYEREDNQDIKERLYQMGETTERLIEQMHGIVFYLEDEEVPTSGETGRG